MVRHWQCRHFRSRRRHYVEVAGRPVLRFLLAAYRARLAAQEKLASVVDVPCFTSVVVDDVLPEQLGPFQRLDNKCWPKLQG